MKRYPLILLVLAFSYAASSCGKEATPLPTGVSVVEDQASLLSGLQSAGATAEITDTVTQDFFTP